MNNTSNSNLPTIPIKSLVNKKFVPLVVGCSTVPDCFLKLQAKLFDVTLIYFAFFNKLS